MKLNPHSLIKYPPMIPMKKCSPDKHWCRGIHEQNSHRPQAILHPRPNKHQNNTAVLVSAALIKHRNSSQHFVYRSWASFWYAHMLNEDCCSGLGTWWATAIVDRKLHMQTGHDVFKGAWFGSDEVCTVPWAARYALTCRLNNRACHSEQRPEVSRRKRHSTL